MCLGLATFLPGPLLFRGSTIVLNSFNFFNSSRQKQQKRPLGTGICANLDGRSKKSRQSLCSALDFSYLCTGLTTNRKTMSRVTIKDKTFETSITEQEIKTRVKAVAEQISRDMEGKNPLLLGVLNGAFVFAADLMRAMTIPCEISFVKLASYQGTTSTGKVTEVIGINEDLTGRTVIIVEDIVESGLTMKRMIETLGTRNPASVHICSLFVKPEKLKVDLNIEYAAFSIPNDFIVGYGLDYDQQGRGLSEIYTLV